MTEWDLAYMRREVKPQPEPIAWGISRADGLILDVITPEEHESHAGEYTVPLYAAPPAAPAVPLTDEQIIALNANEVFFSESPSKYPEAGHGTQYHAGAPGVIAFARAVLSAAPVVREPQDERAAFEAWIRKDCGDLTTFGSGSNMHYRNSAVNNAWTGWKARAAHGIGGGK